MTLLSVLLAVGLVLAAFAAAAETALTSVSRLRMRSLADDGNPRARRVVRLHADPNGYLSTILSVNTVAVIVASTATALIVAGNAHSITQALSTVALSVFVLVFCEIAPKSLALRFSERMALRLAAPVQLITWVLRPLVSALTVVSRLLLRLATRGRPPGPFVTEDELKLIVAMGEREGVVEQEERQMIDGILEMTDKPIHEVMVPRVDVVGVEASRSVGDLISLIIEHGHSRIPVFESTMDNVVGVIYAKDLIRHGIRSDDSRPLRAIAREPYFTPESKHVGELLREMQRRKVHMAVVVEEHGGTAGIVTFEDLIEEIVGPIRDEYDIGEQEDFTFLSDREVVVSARYSVDDTAELLHIDIGETEADTIGGLVYERLGEIPKPGASIPLGPATLTVESVRRHAIQSVRIVSPEAFLSDHDGAPDAEHEAPGTAVSPHP
jgi:putative hemolysin